MQYIDFCCKKNNERTYRVENKKQCHNVLSVDIEKKLPHFLSFFLFVAILWMKQVYLQKL